MSYRSHSRKNRAAYTLLEMLMSLLSATVLLVGLTSSVYVSTQSFDGKLSATVRSQAADVQSDMLNDMRMATGFKVRTATTATFTVPDRNADGSPETISYRYLASPTRQVTYSLNGQSPVTVLNNVQAFRLGYLSRDVNGVAPVPGSVDSGQWGDRWRTTGTFGVLSRGLLMRTDNQDYILTRATLDEDAVVKNLCVYLSMSGTQSVRCGIYTADGSGMPHALRVESSVLNLSGTGWKTFDIPSTPLAPGVYYLALSYKSNKVDHAYDLLGGITYQKRGDATGGSGFPNSWSGGTFSTQKISIYANYDRP